MTLIGDFNAHVKDHYSTSTNDNGKLLNLMVKEQSLALINMNSPTHHQEGRSSTCVDYVAVNGKGHSAILTAKVRDEIYTTSDHDLLEITTNAQLLLLPEHPRQRQRRIPVRKLKNEKRRELYNKLLEDQWETLKDVEFNDPER